MVDDLAVRLLVTLGARSGDNLPKRLPNGLGAAEAKVAALYPKRYQSLLSKLSTREVGEAEKRSAGNRIGYQVIDKTS